MPVTVIKTVEELEAQLAAAGDRLVVIDFFATWCGPCKMIAPKYEQLSNEQTSVVFLKVDADEAEELASKYNVDSLPTFFFIKNGEVLESFPGADYEKLKRTVQTHSG